MLSETDLTPARIVSELDKHIIGQAEAKRAVAVAVRNRWRRRQLPGDLARDVMPKNILMMGPTGVGKTEIARRMAGLVRAPFLKVEATKYTEVGYVGRDVESIIRDLLELAIHMVKTEQAEEMRQKAHDQVQERLVDLLFPIEPDYSGDPEVAERTQRNREKMRQQLLEGAFEDQQVELSLDQKPAMNSSMLSMMGIDQLDAGMGGGFSDMLEKMMPQRSVRRRLKVREAREVLLAQESEKLVDREGVIQQAIERTEQTGMVFIDEIDKIAGQSEGGSGPEVSRQGVQRDLLPIVEGCVVQTKHGLVKTDHILFIAAGAFHNHKPSDLMPEFQGRFPIRVELSDLSQEDFSRILREPRNSLIQQQVALLSTESVQLEFTPESIEVIAEMAYDINAKQQNIGARRLSTLLERVMEDISYRAPELKNQRVVIEGKQVRQKLEKILANKKSRYAL